MALATRHTTSDASGLWASAVSGDVEAFTNIVASYHEDMRRVCVVVTGDESVADDAVASAWSIAWSKLGSLRDPTRLRAWLVSVAVNEARLLIRDRRRRSIVEIPVSQAVEPGGGPDPVNTIASIDLRNALARLDPRDRALLAMRYVCGFEAVELAFALGMSPSGTRARLGRLLHRLERELGDD